MQTMNKIADLNKGFMKSIMNGLECKNPVLQILCARKIFGAAGEVHLTLSLSDGEFFINSAFLASDLIHLHDKGVLVANTIIRVDKYEMDKDKLALTILGLTVLSRGTEVGKTIGVPALYGSEHKPAGSDILSFFNINHSSSSNRESSEKHTNSTMQSSQTSEASSDSDSSSMSQCESERSLTPVKESFFNNYVNVNSLMAILAPRVRPIASLSPNQVQWFIKARVAYKSPLRLYISGEGILFSIELIDESGEIRAIAFDHLAEKYYNMVEVDKVYFIWGCRTRERYEEYPLKHACEIIFADATIIVPCEDTTNIPYDYYNFIPISEIAFGEYNARVDVIGVCLYISEPVTVRRIMDGEEILKRDMQLIDSSNTSVIVTLWHEKAEKFSCDTHSIISVKGAFIIEYLGVKKLSCCNATRLKINPDIVERHELQKWFDNKGKANSFDLDF